MDAFTLQLHFYSDIAKCELCMSGYVAESCNQLSSWDKFLKRSQRYPICLSVLVLFYVSKLEVNCVKFIYGGICAG